MPTSVSTFLVAVLFASVAGATTEPLLDQLRSDHAAMVSAEQDFHSRRNRGILNGNEAADYASYVAGLHRRVAEDCLALAEQGVLVPADLDCPNDSSALIAPAAIDQATEQTGAEATQVLDAEVAQAAVPRVLVLQSRRTSAQPPRQPTVKVPARDRPDQTARPAHLPARRTAVMMTWWPASYGRLPRRRPTRS
jgi:hypothetical protein